MGTIQTDTIDHVARITLSNPPFNALDRGMSAQLHAVLDRCAADPEVRALLLQGDGNKAFSTGSDLGELRGMLGDAERLAAKFLEDDLVFGTLARFPKPTIAAIEGNALGGGLELAVCCDLLVGGQGARFGLPEIRLGAFPGSGGTVRVTRRIGAARARQMMLLGDTIDADTALAWGLIDFVAAEGDAVGHAVRLATRLAHGPALAQRLCKEALDAALELPQAQALALARSHGVVLGSSADLAEGVQAFAEKRKPVFGSLR